MIRDPSDGSVREKRVISGLAEHETKSTDEALRLNKSREWLKGYLAALLNAKEA